MITLKILIGLLAAIGLIIVVVSIIGAIIGIKEAFWQIEQSRLNINELEKRIVKAVTLLDRLEAKE